MSTKSIDSGWLDNKRLATIVPYDVKEELTEGETKLSFIEYEK